MDGYCRLNMDVAGTTELQEGHKSAFKTLAACNSSWRCAAALLAVALCAAGVICVALDFEEQSHTEKNDDPHIHLREISKSARAAIHLEGEYNKTLTSSVLWKTGVDQYHSEGGLKLEGNEIIIPFEGLYFIYSQASFRVSCHVDQGERGGQRVHLSYMVERWTDSYSSDPTVYQTILHSVRTACERKPLGAGDSKAPWFNAVYMGAVFHLNAGDRLKTVMAKGLLPSVNPNAGYTFFGVFAL